MATRTEKTMDFRWVIHEQGTSREYRELQQKCFVHTINELRIIADSRQEWCTVESVYVEDLKDD